MSFRILAGFAFLVLCTACDPVPEQSAPSAQPAALVNASKTRLGAQGQRTFAQVAARMEPVIERECRNRTSGVNCDFRILLDDNPKAPLNAYQTLDKSNRPVIIFTRKMVQSAGNADELAFVLGHEAAHHIRGHIARQQRNQLTGAVVFAGLATLAGASSEGINEATRIGSQIGARSYSKEYELEADTLGTVITHHAGYSPLRGAVFFSRIPDPGDRFLGTHPANSERYHTVVRTLNNIQ